MAKTDKKLINRYFCAILYREDTEFEKYFSNINKYFKEVTYIIHDRDINEDGEIKKEHMHIIFKVGENARHRSSIAEIIDIPENYIQGCNKDNMLKYLIHLNNPEKTQYKLDEVQGELKERLKKFIFKSQTEEERYNFIIKNIENNYIKTISDLLFFSVKNNCLEETKRCQYLLCKMIEEKQQKEKKENVKKKLQNNNNIDK